ncbi:MAG: sigma-70 family RNA polymerase sigma factor [Verrucomicrobia bacterium]|nr:sigma-70 family RNA polymerase sigma factor [Verrucomicrobiota bacterium]
MTTGSDCSVTLLLARAKAGNTADVERLFARCRNYLGVVARAQVESWLRAKADASDIVQETMMQAHRDFAKFRGATEAEWLAWLRKILAHNVADFVRRYRGTEKRQQRLEVPLAPPPDHSSIAASLEPRDPGETPTQEIMRLEREFQVADALTRLPEDYQEVIVLRNLERLPFEGVAQRMGRSRPATQMLWMRAVRKLQEELAHGG